MRNHLRKEEKKKMNKKKDCFKRTKTRKESLNEAFEEVAQKYGEFANR